MPVLDDLYIGTQLTLPKSGAKVWVKDIFTVEQDNQLAEYTDSKLQSVAMVMYAITDWDYTDKEGNKLPITFENVNKLPNYEGQAIMKWLVKRAEKRTEEDASTEAVEDMEKSTVTYVPPTPDPIESELEPEDVIK